jgi:hypothetical protein
LKILISYELKGEEAKVDRNSDGFKCKENVIKVLEVSNWLPKALERGLLKAEEAKTQIGS